MKTIQSFLSEYPLLTLKKVEPNFFQIAGFPHYENVSSNVLQFFLANNLILKSLLDCIPLEYNPAHDFVVYIKREDATEDYKRIDILISTNKYIIGIENKINAGLNNPVGEYGSFLKELAEKEGKKPVFIVLSKKAVEANPEYKNILHRNFSQEIKKHYPELLNDFGYRHFLFFVVLSIPLFIDSCYNNLTAFIAFACLMDARAFSKLLPLNGVNKAIGLPLFVITISCSSGNVFQIFAEDVLKSLTEINFI
jgi:hypothetical protein